MSWWKRPVEELANVPPVMFTCDRAAREKHHQYLKLTMKRRISWNMLSEPTTVPV
jgi:hypothetical protein